METKKKTSLELSQSNMFYKDESTVNYLHFHLENYGNTCLNYSYIERFGVEKLKQDLQELGYECRVKVDPELSPDSIYDYEYDHNRRVRMVYPILPSVLLYWEGYMNSKLNYEGNKEG